MRTDPDDLATDEAAATLRTLLKERNVEMTKDAVRWLAFSTICKWLQSRTTHWAVRRGKAGFGDPDAMMVGFAEAALSQIADKCSDLPMDNPSDGKPYCSECMAAQAVAPVGSRYPGAGTSIFVSTRIPRAA